MVMEKCITFQVKVVILLLLQGITFSHNVKTWTRGLCEVWSGLSWKSVMIISERSSNVDNLYLFNECSMLSINLRFVNANVLNKIMNKVERITKASEAYKDLVNLAPLVIIVSSKHQVLLSQKLMKYQFPGERLMIVYETALSTFKLYCSIRKCS